MGGSRKEGSETLGDQEPGTGLLGSSGIRTRWRNEPSCGTRQIRVQTLGEVEGGGPKMGRRGNPGRRIERG